MKHILPLMLCAGLAAAQDVVTFGDAATGTRVYTTDGTDRAIEKALDAFAPVMAETDPAFVAWTNSEAVVLGRDAGRDDLQFSVAVGNGALAGEEFATAIGAGATATNVSATAVGCGAVASHESATAIGNGARALETGATALGNAAVATGAYSLAWGDHAQATATLATALGPYSAASAPYATAVGSWTRAEASSAVAIGCSATAKARGAVQIGEGTNEKVQSLQFHEWTLVDELGQIPLERLGDAIKKLMYGGIEIEGHLYKIAFIQID